MGEQMSPEGATFEVQVDGFSHKLPKLTTAIFKKLATFQVLFLLPCMWWRQPSSYMLALLMPLPGNSEVYQPG